MWEVNTGVIFAKANRWALHFVRQWLREAREDFHRCRFYKDKWPTEQLCLIHLAKDAESHSPDRIYFAGAQEFNTPWGAFISHMWGGIGGRKGTHEYKKEVKTILRHDRIEDLWRARGVWSDAIRKAISIQSLERQSQIEYVC